MLARSPLFYSFLDLIPDDCTRVVLSSTDEPGSDYFNGNFIDVSFLSLSIDLMIQIVALYRH